MKEYAWKVCSCGAHMPDESTLRSMLEQAKERYQDLRLCVEKGLHPERLHCPTSFGDHCAICNKYINMDERHFLCDNCTDDNGEVFRWTGEPKCPKCGDTVEIHETVNTPNA